MKAELVTFGFYDSRIAYDVPVGFAMRFEEGDVHVQQMQDVPIILSLPPMFSTVVEGLFDVLVQNLESKDNRVDESLYNFVTTAAGMTIGSVRVFDSAEVEFSKSEFPDWHDNLTKRFEANLAQAYMKLCALNDLTRSSEDTTWQTYPKASEQPGNCVCTL